MYIPQRITHTGPSSVVCASYSLHGDGCYNTPSRLQTHLSKEEIWEMDKLTSHPHYTYCIEGGMEGEGEGGERGRKGGNLLTHLRKTSPILLSSM